jgi:hypothetical protein
VRLFQIYAMKRWTEHPSMTQCSKGFKASVDLHMLSFGRKAGSASSAIPFALEAPHNFAVNRAQAPAAASTAEEGSEIITAASFAGNHSKAPHAAAVRDTMKELLEWARRGAERTARDEGAMMKALFQNAPLFLKPKFSFKERSPQHEHAKGLHAPSTAKARDQIHRKPLKPLTRPSPPRETAET